MSECRSRTGFASRPADPEHWSESAPLRPPFSSFTARLAIYVTPELRGRIKIAAFARGVTVAEMLRALLVREFADIDGDRS